MLAYSAIEIHAQSFNDFIILFAGRKGVFGQTYSFLQKNQI